MAYKKSDLPLHKKTLNLVEGDFEAMGALFPSMGASNAIRVLIHSYVKRIRASMAPVDIDVSLNDIKELVKDDGNHLT